MPKPRVFLSSTYYDLRHLRTSLEVFVREIGYEPVLFERGKVSYQAAEKLEDSCVREIGLCDIIINIVGGRLGHDSTEDQPYSITQRELRVATEQGKQVYIFVESSVYNEFHTWQKNRDVEGIEWVAVDNDRVYHFLDEVHALSKNNVVHSFENSSEIAAFLKEQWASLLHRYLQQQTAATDAQALKEVQETAKTLKQLVTFLINDNKDRESALRSILTFNHPLFKYLQQELDITYRIAFVNRAELNALLLAQGFTGDHACDFINPENEYFTWHNESAFDKATLGIKKSLFDDDGTLKPVMAEEWEPSWVTIAREPAMDDIPF